eukprot:3426844-Amphidinium_carterae.1
MDSDAKSRRNCVEQADASQGHLCRAEDGRRPLNAMTDRYLHDPSVVYHLIPRMMSTEHASSSLLSSRGGAATALVAMVAFRVAESNGSPRTHPSRSSRPRRARARADRTTVGSTWDFHSRHASRFE